MSVIGKNIKKLRKEQGITQKQLADSLNISFQAVSKWENEEVVPDTMLLPIIAEFFGVTIDELFQSCINTYANRGDRLLAVYERTGRMEDFLRADYEFQKLLETSFTMELQTSYAILYYYLVKNSIQKTRMLFDAVLENSVKTESFYRVLRWKISFLSIIGRTEESVTYTKKMLKEDTEEVANYECLAEAYISNKQYKEAEEIITTAIEKGFETRSLYTIKGDICQLNQQYEEAFSCWEKAMELDDNYIDALFSMAFCWRKLGKKEKAKEVWEKILVWQSRKGLAEENIFVRKMIVECD